MQPDTAIKLSQKQHDDLLRYVTSVYMFLGGNDLNLRAGLEWRDRQYYRETDWTREQLQAQWANYWGDAKKLQNITIPVVQPQVEAAVGYFAEVFCTGEPFFGVYAPPQQADAAAQMEAVIADNSRRFAWRAESIKVFRDSLKYNLCGMEVDWQTKKVFSIINDPTQRTERAGVSTEELYSGNSFKRIDLYNAILDTRVKPNELHTKGEFAGYVELVPRTALKTKTLELGADNTMNLTKAFSSNCLSYVVGTNTPNQYYIPLINPLGLITNTQTLGQNWMAWFSGIDRNGNIEYRDLYEVATIYARFMPSDFGLPLRGPNTPQIFKLIVVNKQWIIYMQRMTNAHNFLPIVIGQPIDDGLGYQTKGFADNVIPYQQISTSLWNSAMASKRRLVYDRLFYDPSRINKTDIDKVSEVARIPVKPAAYGKPINEAVWANPYRDDNSVGMIDMATKITQLANYANGTNGVQQGQFQKGNKTRTEFVETMNNSNWRPRLMAITMEDVFFQPIKEIVKMNIIQYQGPAELYNPQLTKTVNVNPQDLRKFSFTFKMTDGMTPTERFLNPELMGQMFQLGMAMPQVNVEYDLMGMAIWMLKMQGANWLNDFKRSPEQQQQYIQQTQAMMTAQDPAGMQQAQAQQTAAANGGSNGNG